MKDPLRIFLTAGNIHDLVSAVNLIEGLLEKKLLTDRAYDANKLIELAKKQHMEVVIPPQSRCLEQRDYDCHTYKERHLIECSFEKLKEFHRIAARDNKLSTAFKASVMIATCLIWLQ